MNHNFFLSTVFLFLIFVLFSIILPLFEFQTYSPDSIRFLHFWQNSFSYTYPDYEDNVFRLNIFTSNLYDALHASNYYDLGRGRLIMYFIYGMENILLYSFNTLPINFLIIAIIIINSHGASLIVSRNFSDFKFYIYALSFLIIAINAISLSPTMYFAIYSKYICLTFILYFFIFRSSFLRILMLFLACFTDEIGLLLSLIICFFYLLQFFLLRADSKIVDAKLLIRNIFYSGFICITLLGIFFLTILLTLDTSPMQFAKYAARGTLWLLDPENLLNKLTQLGWTLEVLILGFSIERTIFSTIIGFLMLATLIIFIGYKYKNIKLLFNPSNLYTYIIDFRSHPQTTSLIFWALATLFLLIVLPSSPYAYQTYSYPVMLSIAITLLIMTSIKLKPVKFLKILVLISGIHLAMIPGMVNNINSSNQEHLLKDTSISSDDIKSLQKAINEIRTNQDYELFQSINNSQEIDFSGMWYYSLEEHYRFLYETDSDGNCIKENNYFGNCIQENNYFPIYGTARVLAWPDFQLDKATKNKRQFGKDEPTYKD